MRVPSTQGVVSMISDVRFAAPSPEIQHLPTLFRRIVSGEIRIPAFQRDFVWTQKQVIEILESVFRGYPIGSLLFWRVDERILAVEHSSRTSFPDVPERYPLNFVLDGLQRLSTLYGVFHHGDSSVQHKLNVVFELERQKFMHWEPGMDLTTSINLADIFTPRAFLAAQKRLSDQANSELLLERTITLHSTFQEYMVPTVTLAQRGLADVVQIFERVNSTGTKLDAVDFMRAVTWSEQFDLTKQLAHIGASFEADRFCIPAETLLKIVAVIAGKQPTSASMLELRTVAAEDLNNYVQEAKIVIADVISFLNRECSIFSWEYVPYEGQMLVLSRFFQRGGARSDAKRDALRRWFWAVSFNEELRGKPDHYVVRLLKRLDNFIDDEVDEFRLRLSVSSQDFTERRMLAGAALSGAVAALFAMNSARSFLTGAVIPPEAYMSVFNTEQFVSIVELDEVQAAVGRAVHSSKIMSNIVVSEVGEVRRLRALSSLSKVTEVLERFPADGRAILASQFISAPAVAAALDGDVEAFLDLRAYSLFHAAASLVGHA